MSTKTIARDITREDARDNAQEDAHEIARDITRDITREDAREIAGEDESVAQAGARAPMRYICKLRLENFQDHADTVIEFQPGINLITGSSDVGKSAILRAINFLFHNQPRTKSFIQIGTNEARVTAEFSDGLTVQRIKGDTRNAVVLHHKDWQEPIIHEKFGHEYPSEVLEALGSPPVDVEEGPLAYAEQMANLFLVSLSATDLPRCISRLTGIDDFEEASKLLSQKANAAKKRAKECETRIARVDEDLEQYAQLDRQLEALEVIETSQKELETLEEEIVDAQRILSAYRLVLSQGRTAATELKKAQKVTAFAEPLKSVLELEKTARDQAGLLARYKEKQRAIEREERALARAQRIGSQDHQKSVQALHALGDLLTDSRKMQADHAEVMRKGRVAKGEMDAWLAERDALVKQKETLIEELRAQGHWCSTCNRPLTADHVHERQEGTAGA